MHRFRRFGKRDEYTHWGFLAFHHMRQIADHCHIDILAAFDGYSRFLMDAISGVNARGRLSCGLASLHNELRLKRAAPSSPRDPRVCAFYGELWPAHCMTPRNLVHGPTASRY
jgi:hypothetical protein